MNDVLRQWNSATVDEALAAMISCCGARQWASGMVALRPLSNVMELSNEADRVWGSMKEEDWMEAFACHPRIGEEKASSARAQSEQWSSQEQAAVIDAPDQTLTELAEGNALYEERFGFTYIVCATGKSAEEMLEILTRRLRNNRESELLEAAEQQRQILQIRLGKWLVS